MQYEMINPPKVADAIVSQIEQLILEGVLKPGERLPPERELAHQLNVSRPSLREAIKARDVSCRFPGCHSRAEFFDCDHIVPHPEGETCSANLAGLCRRHHRTKTFSTWKVERDPLAPRHELVWTSPLGRRYRTASHRYARNE